LFVNKPSQTAFVDEKSIIIVEIEQFISKVKFPFLDLKSMLIAKLVNSPI
jgi:hypothetical protein